MSEDKKKTTKPKGKQAKKKDTSKGKNPVGRPTVITDGVVRKLEDVFLKGLSDREACLHVGISPTTLYEYCSQNPEFAERKELLKEQPKIKAKLNINEEIQNGNTGVSQWYLERRAKDEFSSKQEFDVKAEQTITTNPIESLTPEQIKAYAAKYYEKG